MSFPGFHRCRWLAGLLLVGLAQRLTPWARAEDPAWLKINGLPEVSAGAEVEGSSEQTHVAGGTSTYDSMFVTPTAGARTSGSIYHPDLLTFDLDGEVGWGWDHQSTSSSGSTQSHDGNHDLLRYLAEFNLLESKPYNASFFATQDHTYRDYGSLFGTSAVDSERYGGRVNWNTDNLSLNTDFGHRDEKDSGFNDSSEIIEDYFNFMGMQHRDSGQTTLTGRFDKFENNYEFAGRRNSQTRSVGLSDAETFGAHKQISEATGVSYGQSEYAGRQTDTLTANENITVKHRPKLDSYLILNFAHNQLHPATDTRMQGVVGVRHQLYDSLTSGLDLHGSHQENSSLGSSATSDRFGLGVNENYTKRLQSWGRLSVGVGLVADHENDHSTGSVYTTIDEAHQIYLPTSPSYHPVYLDRPRVLAATIVVNVGGDVLVENTDYLVIASGELTEIRLIIPPSSHVLTLLGASDNLAVSVTYQSDSLNNAAFEALNANAQIRLDLYNRVGLYGRVNWMDNNAPPEILVQSLTDLVAGVDYNWRWLRTGAEVEKYDSNFSEYEALRFFQNLTFRLDEKSTLGLNGSETFYRYSGNNTQDDYQFFTRYSLQLLASLAWYVEGGCSFQDVMGTDQVQGSARTGVNWTRGKMSFRAGYEYNAQSTSGGGWTQERVKNRLFAYLKRTF